MSSHHPRNSPYKNPRFHTISINCRFIRGGGVQLIKQEAIQNVLHLYVGIKYLLTFFECK